MNVSEFTNAGSGSIRKERSSEVKMSGCKKFINLSTCLTPTRFSIDVYPLKLTKIFQKSNIDYNGDGEPDGIVHYKFNQYGNHVKDVYEEHGKFDVNIDNYF